MSGETMIAIVTIICTCIVTVTQLIVRSNVIELKRTVGDQTIELAKLHQTVLSQSATIYRQEAQQSDLIEKIPQSRALPKSLDWEAYPPYRKGDKDSDV